jgi:YHS domain-containing protein
MAKDPICGMMVDEKTAKFKSDYQGKTYYFCAASCKNTFDKNPAKYAKSTSSGHDEGCCCGGH